jgi:hypothetical protein
VLHCTNKECNHEVIRYKWKDDPKPQPEPVKSKLFPAAQAVLDAYGSSPLLNDHVLDHRHCLAAALRAAAEELQYRLFLPGDDPMVVDAKALFNLANELEGSL